MGSSEIDFDPDKRDGRPGGEHHDKAVSPASDVSLLNEEIFSFQYFLRTFFFITTPVLTVLVIFNLMKDRIVEVVILGALGILHLWIYFAMQKAKSISMPAEQQYRIYQNFVRGFLFLIIILISYTAGWRGELDRLLWSYIVPIAAFFYLGRREGFYWVAFFLASAALFLFYPHTEALSADAFHSFKLTYLLSFSVMCAVGIAGKYGIEFTYARFAHREAKLAESEKKYREAYEDLQREMGERRQAQQALLESEEKYRLIFENSIDVIYSLDTELRTIDISPSIREVLGYSPSELIGRPIRELGLMTPESLKCALSDAARALGGTLFHTASYTFIAKDGTKHYTEAAGAPIRREEEVVGIILVMRDITERKQAEMELLREKLFTEKLLESLPGIFFLYDSTCRLKRWNKAHETNTGFSADELRDWYIPDWHETPEDAAMGMALVKSVLETGVGGAFETTLINKEGHFVPYLISVTGLLTPDGPAMMGVGIDITDRKRAEETKRSLEERLQRAEKMEALGKMAGGVAHDLNNVLGVLSGYSQLLLLETPEGSPSRAHAETILQSTVNGAAIIQDLLTIARRSVTASDVINLNSIVSDFLKTPVFEEIKDYNPRVTFRTECDKELLNIKGSSVHVEKTVMNLVSNAAEAISGAGEVVIRTENHYLDTPLRGYEEIRHGDYVVLTISDTGMGIPAEDREKIFEPFYTKKAMGRSGTGLGLAIVWGTVKDHNGYIDVQTGVGEGTAFTLYFPVTREEPIAPQRQEPIERYMGKGESVLVVDDIVEQRDVAAGLLTRLGYDVHVVSSGEEAVEYLKRHKSDILVLDMIMDPGIDGLETYRRIREIRSGQKAIIVSGFSETDKVREAQKLGAGAYVKKPYMMEKIGTAIRDELNR
jgi:two-component system cell cycle sensor histidine kinase/response regulator CckA